MPVKHLVRLNDYYYDNRASYEEELVYRTLIGDTPGRHGKFRDGGFVDQRRVTAKGRLFALNGDSDSLRDAVAAFRWAHSPSPLPKKLYLQQDRYVNADVEQVSNMEWRKPLSEIEYSVSFVCANPFVYSEATFTHSFGFALGATTANETIATGGTWDSAPSISFDVTAAPVGSSITIANTSTAQTFVYKPTTIGVHIADTEIEKVSRGGVDSMSGMTGEFLLLAPGNNSMAVTLAGGITVGTITFTWRNRWL